MELDPFQLPDGFTIPTNEEVDALVVKAESLQKTFNTFGDGIDDTVAKKAQEIKDSYSANTGNLHNITPGDMEGAMRVADAKADKETRRFRQGLLKLNEETINDQLRQLQAAHDRVTGLLRVYPSPQAYLSAQHLGDPKRTEFLRQIDKAGPAEVATMARLAMATNNRALAAAVQSKLDSMPKDSRPFSGAEFAERMVGPEHNRYVLAAKRTNNAFQSAINRSRALASGKGNSHETIKSGLRKAATDRYQRDKGLADFVAAKPPINPPPQPGGK